MMTCLFKNKFIVTALEQLYYSVGRLEFLKTQKVNSEDLFFVYNLLEENEYFQQKIQAYCDDDIDYRYSETKETYGKYAGSYAQDIEGFSDDFIDDVLEGEPSAYWNID